MIRNIVFDLGNVLISFRPAEYLKRNGYPEELREKILSDIFRSNEWLLLDNGNIDLEEAIWRISRRSSLKQEEIALIFKKRTEIMFPLEQNIRMLPELNKHGFQLFYLSNFPGDIFDAIKTKNNFFSLFTGGIISAEVRFSKPDPAIFKIFLERYALVPSETFYIDDIESNVKAAESLGMIGFFTGGSEDISEKVLSMVLEK